MIRPLKFLLYAGLVFASIAGAQAPESDSFAASDSVLADEADTTHLAPIPSDDTEVVPAIPAASEQPDTMPSDPPPLPMGRPGMRGPGPESRPEPVAEPLPEPSAALSGPTIITEPIDEDSALKLLLKTDPEAARRYRSPRKAFFFSLLVPGAGQAYVGAWGKMALFAAAEIGLGVGWYQVAVVASREKAREAERFAAKHWRQEKYERQWLRLFADTSASGFSSNGRQGLAPNRESYCASLYLDENPSNYQACIEAPTSASTHFGQFAKGDVHSDPTDSETWSEDQVLDFRANNIKDRDRFHDLIGRYAEFTGGWEDALDTVSTAGLKIYFNLMTERVSDPSIVLPSDPWGTSRQRLEYLSLRQRSDDLARTQKWFLGGMVLNHVVAAVDAALQATRMNRKLLKLETSWVDRLEVEGGMAIAPRMSTHATLAWRF